MINSVQMIQDGMTPQERLPGIYRAWCKANNDPEMRGRIKVYIPEIHDSSYQNNLDSLPWAEYCTLDGGGNNYGFFFIPNVGDTVFVSFLRGEYLYPVWIGAWYGAPGGKSEIPSQAQSNYPEVRVLKTRAGHYISFIDKAGSEAIIIADKNGNTIEFDSNPTGGGITIDVEGDLSINVTGDMNVSVAGTWSLKADAGMTEETPGQLQHKASNIQNNSYSGI